MTWSVNNLFGLEIGKNLQKYSPTHGKPGIDLFFFFFGGQHGKILLVDMMASKKKKKVNTSFSMGWTVLLQIFSAPTVHFFQL